MSLLARVFSDRYVNEAAIGSNLLLLAMYRFAYPFALLLGWLRLSPNVITTLSLLCALVSALSLVFESGAVFFAVFWGFAVLLDFCDGTVARMTGTVREIAFRYDHFSDLIKIFFVILGVGYRYNGQLIWGGCLTTSFAFMFYVVINHDLGATRQRLRVSQNDQVSRCSAAGLRWPLLVMPALKAALLTINGHTLLVFFLMPFGRSEAIIGLGYFLALSALRAARCVNIMLGLPK